ncbi:ricin-type beta-trefoil lectin domain protein [Catenulispora sp. GP43]|uniref:ricin-type beta-trefoil lectin domain protein n=1 Tax=Catenulispora sp. GP43 TaxID=3156263 RepID=UPI0035132527
MTTPHRGRRIMAMAMTTAAAATLTVASGAAFASNAHQLRPVAAGATADAAGPLQVQEWLYPGPVGNVTCSAPAEYADGRVQKGVLKAEYIDIDGSGDPETLFASNPAYACNGYSAANVADVKAHSAQQYVTVSLADLSSEEALTGSPAKTAAAISAITSLVKSIGFTGADVDFENYWSWVGDDQANYYNFLTRLAASLHASGLKLQVEGPPDTTTGFNYGTVLADGVDQVVMMAYDDEYQSPVGSTCLAFSPYSWMQDLLSGALAQIPAAQRYRFVAGLPAEAYTATAKCQTIVGNQTVADMAKAPGYSTDPAVIASRRDPGSGEIRWSSGGAFYDYVDQTALDSKLQLVRNLGISTISVWTLGGGNAWFSANALNAVGPTTYVGTASNRCLDMPSSANQTRADVYDCDGSANQSFVHATDNSLQVLGKCLDAQGRKTAPGTPVVLYTCNGQTNQQWAWRSDGTFVGVQSGLCLDVTGGAVVAPNGTSMELWPCTGQSNQAWTAR